MGSSITWRGSSLQLEGQSLFCIYLSVSWKGGVVTWSKPKYLRSGETKEADLNSLQCSNMVLLSPGQKDICWAMAVP